MDMVERTVAVGGVLLAVAAIQVWREKRRDRWHAAGLCYQCGQALAADSRDIRLQRRGEYYKTVRYCAHCARGRDRDYI